MSPIIVRNAVEADLVQVNSLRRMVNELHVNGRPDFFRGDAWSAIEGQAEKFLRADDCELIVATVDDQVAGFAMVNFFDRPENPYMKARHYYHVEEFGVSEAFRRLGVATALVDYMKQDAIAHGFTRIELDMWEFNQSALAFYEHAGFGCFRRYMELDLTDK